MLSLVSNRGQLLLDRVSFSALGTKGNSEGIENTRAISGFSSGLESQESQK